MSFIRKALLALVLLLPLAACTGNAATTPGVSAGGPGPPVGGSAPLSPTHVCNQSILNSPWHYAGPAGVYTTSGTPPGLPTFGSPGTDFPNATKVIIVPPGDNTNAANGGSYAVNNAVIYFEPGMHTITSLMYAGDHSAYVGGYIAAAGKAIINGVDGATSGSGSGRSFEQSHPITNNAVYDTWEYLTVENYASGVNSSIMGNIDGGGRDSGDVYKYDTIGPNEYAYTGSSTAPALNTDKAPGQGGGYAIDAQSFTTIEYDCITRDAQGGVNISDAVDTRILNNEFSYNGLGEYPDGSGAGASPHSCGCSSNLGKIFYSLNTDIIGNYIHDGYHNGLWIDTNESGDDISRNYIASNWSQGIMYESSYNANISDNTLYGNGWPSHGLWPAGYHGGTCFNNVPCQYGFGADTAEGGGLNYPAIYLPNSGGDSALTTVRIPSTITVPGCASSCTVTSRYSGHLYVTGNRLINNFGGIDVYTDPSRFPSVTTRNASCDEPLGTLHQQNNATYYMQYKELLTESDTSISGTSVSSVGGTQTICTGYDSATPGSDITYTYIPKTPVAGMYVYDQSTGKEVGTLASAASPNSFTLAAPPPGGSYATGDRLLLQQGGGCGFPDFADATRPGQVTGSPAAPYWDHCLWGSRNITVSGNYFSINAAQVSRCTNANGCGWMQQTVFNPGVATLDRLWFGMINDIKSATGGLNIVWSGNAYHWEGTGGWSFHSGLQGTADDITRAAWLSEGQDSSSTFGS